MVEKKSRFTFVNNYDTALTVKENTFVPDELPKKRSRHERGSSSDSVEANKKKKHKKDKKKRKQKSSSSDDSSGDDEQARIRNAAIAQIELKFNHKDNPKPERDARLKDEPLPKVN